MTSRSRWLVGVVALAVIAGTASADPEAEAKVHVDKAATLHGEGNYAEALAELAAAYKIDPQPGLLYAMAQVQVKLQRCADAIPNYEKFIASSPGAVPEKAAHEAIDACKVTLANQAPPPPPDPTPAPVPVPVDPTPPSTPPSEPTPERPGGRAWYKDPVGGIALGGGVVGVVVGVVLYRSATADIDAAEAASNYGASEDLVDRASRRRIYAAIAGTAGAALITTGVIRYLSVRRHEQHAIAIVPTTGGAVLGFGGRF